MDLFAVLRARSTSLALPTEVPMDLDGADLPPTAATEAVPTADTAADTAADAIVLVVPADAAADTAADADADDLVNG